MGASYWQKEKTAKRSRFQQTGSHVWKHPDRRQQHLPGKKGKVGSLESNKGIATYLGESNYRLKGNKGKNGQGGIKSIKAPSHQLTPSAAYEGGGG